MAPARSVEEINRDVGSFMEATSRVLMSYMGGNSKIEMLVGRNTTATLSFSGGPITRETIEDVLAHLVFYKRYFPKASEPTGELDTAEKIIAALRATWDERVSAPNDHSLSEPNPCPRHSG